MQITGVQLAAVIYPKSFEFQKQTRSPVIIDVKPTVVPDEKSSHQAVSNLSLYQQAITTYEGQQTRFVRMLATTEQPSGDNGPAIQSDPLPRGVQQYLQVADSVLESEQRLFDEIV